MAKTGLTASELAASALRSSSSALTEDEAGALRLLERSRGLPTNHGSVVGAVRLDVLERLAFAAASLLAVAGLCFAVLGVLLLIQTIPWLHGR